MVRIGIAHLKSTMKKRILFISFYYEPDLCAGSFRVTPLVRALRDLAPEDVEIEVLTTMPNRYATFQHPQPNQEESPKEGLRITRLRLPQHRNGMRDQAKSFLAFALGVWRHVRGKRYDLVAASSSRLMTAVLASQVASIKKARLYLDIRDIFVENMEDVVPYGLFRMVRPLFVGLERWAYRRADRINLISPAFIDYFTPLTKARLSTHTNGIDEEFLGMSPTLEVPAKRNGILKITYAGNIGEGQGLEQVLPRLAVLLQGRAQFEVIGDGGRRRQLQAGLVKQKINNVEWHPPMERSKLLAKYREADVLFLHLNNYPAFRRLLPSKVFEYAATGKPIWAGLCGFSKEFAKKSIENCAVFESGNIKEAAESFSELILESQARTTFVEKFRRQNIDKEMARDILGLIR